MHKMLIAKKFYFISFFLFIVLTALLFFSPFSQWLSNRSFDLLLQIRGMQTIHNKIVLVKIDDQSIQELKEKWPWNRTRFASLIEQIAQDSPSVIGLDFTFSEFGNHAEDKALQQTLHQSKIPIVFGMNLRQEMSGMILEKGVELSVFDHVKHGFLNIETQTDGIIRHATLQKKLGQETFYSFAAELYRNIANTADIAQSTVLIDFAGKANTIPWVSAYQVEQKLLTSGYFKNKIVLIGPTFIAAHDFHRTSGGYYMSGVEIHAQLLNMLLLNKKLYPLKHSFTLILILCYSILFFFLFIIPLPRFFFYGGLLLLFILALLLPVIVFHQNSIIFPFITALICAILWVFILYWARMAIKVQEFKKAVSEFNAEHHNPFLDFCKKHTISKREEEVILLLLKNLTTMQIANKLFISLYTVKKHLTNIYQKTGMENREKLCEALAQKSLN